MLQGKKTYAGLIVAALCGLGLVDPGQISPEDVETTIKVIGLFGGIALSWYGRWQAGREAKAQIAAAAAAAQLQGAQK